MIWPTITSWPHPFLPCSLLFHSKHIPGCVSKEASVLLSDGHYTQATLKPQPKHHLFREISSDCLALDKSRENFPSKKTGTLSRKHFQMKLELLVNTHVSLPDSTHISPTLTPSIRIPSQWYTSSSSNCLLKGLLFKVISPQNTGILPEIFPLRFLTRKYMGSKGYTNFRVLLGPEGFPWESCQNGRS